MSVFFQMFRQYDFHSVDVPIKILHNIIKQAPSSHVPSDEYRWGNERGCFHRRLQSLSFFLSKHKLWKLERSFPKGLFSAT